MQSGKELHVGFGWKEVRNGTQIGFGVWVCWHDIMCNAFAWLREDHHHQRSNTNKYHCLLTCVANIKDKKTDTWNTSHFLSSPNIKTPFASRNHHSISQSIYLPHTHAHYHISIYKPFGSCTQKFLSILIHHRTLGIRQCYVSPHVKRCSHCFQPHFVVMYIIIMCNSGIKKHTICISFLKIPACTFYFKFVSSSLCQTLHFFQSMQDRR